MLPYGRLARASPVSRAGSLSSFATCASSRRAKCLPQSRAGRADRRAWSLASHSTVWPPLSSPPPAELPSCVPPYCCCEWRVEPRNSVFIRYQRIPESQGKVNSYGCSLCSPLGRLTREFGRRSVRHVDTHGAGRFAGSIHRTISHPSRPDIAPKEQEMGA